MLLVVPVHNNKIFTVLIKCPGKKGKIQNQIQLFFLFSHSYTLFGHNK